jgi:hypothetical protein
MGGEMDRPDSGFRLPRGLSAKEAVFLLGVFARLKEKGSGRLEVTVSDGRIVDIQLVERLDRTALAGPDQPG